MKVIIIVLVWLHSFTMCLYILSYVSYKGSCQSDEVVALFLEEKLLFKVIVLCIEIFDMGQFETFVI